MRSKLYILRPVDDWEPWYDKCFGAVVSASSPSEARKLVAEVSGDEGEGAWLNPTQTTCRELKPSSKPTVIIRDFSAA